MSAVWLVTGAGRGLGEAIAQAALEAGHQVVATARNTCTVHEVFGDVPVHRLLRAKLDVTDLNQAHQVAPGALDAFGRVDVLVNDAGYGQLSAFEETTPEEVRGQLDTNLFGLMNVTRAVRCCPSCVHSGPGGFSGRRVRDQRDRRRARLLPHRLPRSVLGQVWR
jgi:NAD(P)-dependent dehydrogenase (short-subunit alcohol dehydrogenase family)